LLASQGFAELKIGGEVSAAVVSTGDELVTPGDKLQSGQIYESNSVLLQALLRKSGARVELVKQCGDDLKSLDQVLQSAVRHTVSVVTGGVSVGKHDLVQLVLRSLGAKVDISRVAIKPGKPFLFGRIGDRFVFGLPGNPVSAFVTFLQFVRPAILKMMGATDLDLPKVPAKLIVDVRNEGDRPHYIRGKLENGNFAPVGRQESHALFGLSQSNALLRVGPDESAKAGTIVDIQMLD